MKLSENEHITKIDDDYSCMQCGKLNIILMNKNGYINANKLCSNAGKEFRKWKENKISLELISELSISLDIPAKDLMEIPNVKNELRGTYIHQQLIIHVAYWCGPNFAIKMGKWINEWRKYSPDNDYYFFESLSNITPYSNRSEEKEIQNLLHKRMGGEIEVKTSTGKIDLLTDKYLIEIKNYNDWKCAIGQLIAYSYEYKNRQKIMYLFGVPQDNILDKISAICAEYNIKVKTIDREIEI